MSKTLPSVLQLELAGLNSWPAQTQLLVNGWLVRLGDGYTKRANSVTAPFPYHGDLMQDLAYVESLYLAGGLPPIFRLTETSQPDGLDQALAERGYQVLDPTLVLARHLDAPPEMPSGVDLGADREPWLAAYAQLSPTSPERLVAHKALLERITLPYAYIEARTGSEEPVGCALAIRDRQYVGIFDLIVAPRQRRKGLGRSLVEAALAWGAQHGGEIIYLQVVEANQVGRAFYASLGFDQRYRYWYRAPALLP